MNFTKVEPKDFGERIMKLNGISAKAVEEHLKLYKGYIDKYNQINEELMNLSDDDFAKANQTYSKIRELKMEMTFAYGGVVNHELYFSHLGGEGGTPSGDLMKQIEKDFGSLDAFKKDVKASGIAARGWVWTAWNHREERLFNYIGDAQNTFPVWYATPVMALDTYEHAYFMDFGSNRGNYIDVFFNNVDWSKVEENFMDVMETGCGCGGACDGNCDHDHEGEHHHHD